MKPKLNPELQASIDKVFKYYKDEYKMAYEIIGNLYSENPTKWPVMYIMHILEEIDRRNGDNS
jgi:hypothetical protein